jgi:hypothetical protein
MAQSLAPAEQPERASEGVGGDVPNASRPAPLAPNDGGARIAQITGERIAAYLQERGLSEVDSERIAADQSRQLAECSIQAIIALEALTETTADSLRDRMDALGANLTTCQESTAQQAGIPLSVLQDALRGAAMASAPGAEQ